MWKSAVSAFAMSCALLAASDRAEVFHDDKRVLEYTAAWEGDFLVVRADIEPGWHTFVMDNKQRQQEKLAGKPSLGIEKSTEIKAVQGLELGGSWLQSEPRDFSKPEIRWFTWGFEREALFAARAKPAGSGPAQIEVTGQACAQEICKNIDVVVTVPARGGHSGRVDLKALTPVRR